MVLEFSPMPLGFSMVLPCILTPQNLLKLYGFQVIFHAEITRRTFLKKFTKKRYGRFFS